MPIFNPLFHTEISQSLSSDPLTSISKVVNNDIGKCPKCQGDMTKATIATDDTVFFCESCCVSSPLPNE